MPKETAEVFADYLLNLLTNPARPGEPMKHSFIKAIRARDRETAEEVRESISESGARAFFLAGGGGHEDGEDGARAATFSFEGMVSMAVAYAEYISVPIDQPAEVKVCRTKGTGFCAICSSCGGCTKRHIHCSKCECHGTGRQRAQGKGKE